MNNNAERAKTLVEALPYIQKFRGKVIVIKYGGNAMINKELLNAVMADVLLLQLVGIHVVLVHGGGPEINDLLSKVGIEPKFINGLRYTDKETMNIVQSVLCGKVNKDLVANIIRRGGRAIGICGIDGYLFKAKKLDKGDGLDYGLVGEITEVVPEVVNRIIEDDRIPVIATVAQAIDAEEVYNVNADTAAAKLAVAMNAEKLILLTDTIGVLRTPGDALSLIKVIHPEEIPGLIDSGIISGGMIPKIECCASAIEGGVARTHILDGRTPHSILIELLTDEGAGTMILAPDK